MSGPGMTGTAGVASNESCRVDQNHIPLSCHPQFVIRKPVEVPMELRHSTIWQFHCNGCHWAWQWVTKPGVYIVKAEVKSHQATPANTRLATPSQSPVFCVKSKVGCLKILIAQLSDFELGLAVTEFRITQTWARLFGVRHRAVQWYQWHYVASDSVVACVHVI
jgi:hypothetical protein